MLYLAISLIAFSIVFVFFLVITRTLGSVVNHLTKIEYWILQEMEFHKEQEEIRRALESEEHASEPSDSAEPVDPFQALQQLQKLGKPKPISKKG